MPPNTANHLPPGVTVRDFAFGWAGTDRTDPKNQFDVMMLGTDGNLYHEWYVPNEGWNGPEIMNALD